MPFESSSTAALMPRLRQSAAELTADAARGPGAVSPQSWSVVPRKAGRTRKADRLRLSGLTRGATVAVAIIMDFDGASLDQYDQIIEKMGLQDGSTPSGAIFHWVAKTDGGLRVVDV